MTLQNIDWSPAILRPQVSSCVWPVISTPVGATLLSLLFQMENIQWQKSDEIRERQLAQAACLIDHSTKFVPYYRKQLSGNWQGENSWASLPIMTKLAAQEAGNALSSEMLPTNHGRRYQGHTSGSTGRPLAFGGTDITAAFWHANLIRDHLWHKRDMTKKLAAIRTKVEKACNDNWGGALNTVFVTGPSVGLNIRENIASQAAWLADQRPAYLTSHPSNLLALANYCLEKGIEVKGIEQVICFGECTPPDLPGRVSKAWDAALLDTYSCEEAGFLALQCPISGLYHIMAESVLLEVLDAQDLPCKPGQVGRVVLTPLHNFATPFIRYELGDYAEVGPPCSCGRGLPTLKRILGRQRNMLRFPDGGMNWPSFPAEMWLAIAPVRQMQLVQESPDLIRARIIMDRGLTIVEKEQVTKTLQESLGYPFRIVIEQADVIPRSDNGKYEDFISLLT